jgi:glutamine amidotransferase
MTTIAIIDYGIGNLRSVEKALQHVGADARLSTDWNEIQAADGVVLPGVGAFGACATALRSVGFEPLVRALADAGKPLLGICVGMQLLFEGSEEMGWHVGLGLLPGQVRRFPDGQRDRSGALLKVPQIGWNQVWHQSSDLLLAGIESGSYAYFVHSFYCEPADRSHIVATTDFAIDYASVVRRDNIWGVQFHPEKSHQVGLRLLGNFVNLLGGGSPLVKRW